MTEMWALVTTAGLAFVSVTLWTVRVALTAAGQRTAGAAVAGLEAVTFTFAFARIVSNLDNAAGIVAYALGVGLGTLAGVLLDERLSRGQSWVHVIVKGDGRALSTALARRRWPVTAVAGRGPEGEVSELAIALDDRKLPALSRDLAALAPGVFWTTERVRHAHPAPLPASLRQMGEHSARPSLAPLSLRHGGRQEGSGRGRAAHRRPRRDGVEPRQGLLR